MNMLDSKSDLKPFSIISIKAIKNTDRGGDFYVSYCREYTFRNPGLALKVNNFFQIIMHSFVTYILLLELLT